MGNLIVVEPIEPGIVSITLNRAERRNALSIELLEQLCSELLRLEHDSANRVVILGAAGPLFSAGLDLREAANASLVERSAMAVARALQHLRDTPLIAIATVQGGAFAGGAGLMAACDIVIAASDAKIGFPEARRGLLPALICNVLRHKVRDGDLRDLFLAGDPIDAARAQQIGLVQRIVPASQLRNAAITVARSVTAGGPHTIRQTKALLNETFAATDKVTGSELLQKHLAARFTDEAQQGIAAFNEKRERKWD